jgi:hypothetical protein
MSRLTTGLNAWLNAGPVGRLLRSRGFVPGALLLLLLLCVAVVGAQALARAGLVAALFVRSQSGITITGPGASANATMIQVYCDGRDRHAGCLHAAAGCVRP